MQDIREITHELTQDTIRMNFARHNMNFATLYALYVRLGEVTVAAPLLSHASEPHFPAHGAILQAALESTDLDLAEKAQKAYILNGLKVSDSGMFLYTNSPEQIIFEDHHSHYGAPQLGARFETASIVRQAMKDIKVHGL